MNFQEYQAIALKTDQAPGADRNSRSLIVPLLGLAGEAGTLLTEYKKWFREGNSYKIFKERISEELGDILWYVSNIASKEGLDLQTIALENLQKAQNRWLPNSMDEDVNASLFDNHYPASEQIPREFEVHIFQETINGKKCVKMNFEATVIGDSLTDNSYENDGYRFHDIFHLSYASILGWSPVIRKFLSRKRKSNPTVDEVEDGGRATAIEEAISAIVFDYAMDHNFLEEVDHVDYGILRSIKQLTRKLEVSRCSEFQWQYAILQGFQVWRVINKAQTGRIRCNLLKSSIEVVDKL